MGTRSLRLALLAAMGAAALAGCGGGSPTASNGIASKSAHEILAAARGAAQTLHSVHVSGTVVTQGQPLSLDLQLVAGRGGRGSIAAQGGRVQIVEIATALYLNGNSTFWRVASGSALAAQKLSGKWVRVPGTAAAAQFSQVIDLHALLGRLLAAHGASLNKAGTTTVDGRAVVALHDVAKGGTLYVAATGSPYPVEIRSPKGAEGQVLFDRFNQSVPLSVPAGAVDASSIVP